MGYIIVFIIVSLIIGVYFSKRDKPMTPSSWYKGIAILAFAMVIVSGFYSVDAFKQGFKEGMKEESAIEDDSK
ncbi:hypothetical protein [Staphylococcus caeli]|uniref:hypothetical protein n=1 Tax=Staphylococcus caeli TaxID=2201815 RepID=UPI003F572B17